MTDTIYEKLLAAKKYSDICPDTLKRVADECAAKYKKAKDAEKAAKEALHGITGAFMDAALLKNARHMLDIGDIEGALKLHSSTRERMPLSSFYNELFSRTGKPESILDLACGLNPIYLGSIGLSVTGVDISGAQIRLINEWAAQNNLYVRCYVGDALCDNFIPDGQWDMTLIMKLLPVIENQRKGSARALLDMLNTPSVVVTFPTRTLGGRKVGMEQHYTDWFERLIPEKYAVQDRYICNDELVYILARAECAMKEE